MKKFLFFLFWLVWIAMINQIEITHIIAAPVSQEQAALYSSIFGIAKATTVFLPFIIYKSATKKK